ncbi:MAG: hypothetical protein R3A52_04315 [Polyangiales bacterium]
MEQVASVSAARVRRQVERAVVPARPRREQAPRAQSRLESEFERFEARW